MARGLQCPACGERHRIDGAAAGSTFKCGGCARTLRVPGSPATSVGHGGASAPSVSVSVPPEPQRQSSAGSNRIHLPPYEGDLPLAARVVSWVIAIPVAGFITLKVAVFIGLLSTNDLIDLITGSGGGRYLRMVIFIPLWALFSAGVVSLVLEIGERLLANYGSSISSANPQRSASTRPRNRPKTSGDSTVSSPSPADKTRVNAAVAPDLTDRRGESGGEPQSPRRIPPR